ncbi:MAG: glycosyltransferase family 2 protein [Methanomicrobiales archaeon]
MAKITAILPAYNEEVSIGSMVLRTAQYVDRVIVVDDGSTDETANIARMAGAEVASHPLNMGKGAALKTGFNMIEDADVVVTIDADGQHYPKEIPALVKPIVDGEADVVNGSRYIHGTDENTPAYRRVGQKVLDTATNISSGLKITDTQSGYRAFAGHTVPLFRFKDSGFGVESEMLVDAANNKLRIVEVEIGVRYDVDGSTKHPLSHGIRVLIKIIREIEINQPLYYFTIPGLIIVIIGLIISLFFIRDYITGKSITMAPTLLMIMITLAGIFMTFTGIILDSISRLIERSINR